MGRIEREDEEIIRLIQQGNQELTDYIMEKYKNLVKKKAKAMYILGGDSDDLIQEGMIGLFKAIRDFDCERDYSFYTFADICISRQMYSAIKAAGRQKHVPLNTYISFHAMVGSEDEEGELLDILQSVEKTPEELIISREDLQQIGKIIERKLSSFEKEVLELYISGVSYKEIAKILGKSDKSIDNALQRMKGKLAGTLKNKGD
ncbi:MAG: RNA polymerase sporulation sigma factor SigH [Lachnospiraceae bacterium]|nr:RNA polymerase sporulation sigma factor SigH [Lachnospiraceae bacterium]